MPRRRRRGPDMKTEHGAHGVVRIYADGACKGNPGPGGWGMVLRSGTHVKELYGGEPATTNNRMELMAVIQGLGALTRRCNVTLYTDSQYVHKGISIWISDWKRRGWRTAVPRKSEMAGLLKKRMGDKRFFFPLLTWEKPYRGDVCNEFNVERFALRRDGGLAFSHPQGTHDDVFWACALAVYATVTMEAFDPEAAHFG